MKSRKPRKHCKRQALEDVFWSGCMLLPPHNNMRQTLLLDLIISRAHELLISNSQSLLSILSSVLPLVHHNVSVSRSLHLIFNLPPWILIAQQQHYTVRDIEVMAECKCSGQQISCEKSNTTGRYECVCGGNTMGENCETCQPFYNQQPFRYGVACEACNCFQHADSCYYDKNVADSNKSLNAKGEYSGGGVCIDCRDNTTGEYSEVIY